MAAITRADIAGLLGAVDDHFIAEIIGVSATKQELVEAKIWMTNDESLFNEGRRLAIGRVGQIIDILRRAEAALPAVDPEEP